MEILTIGQAAKRKGVTRQCIYQAIERGILSPVTLLGKKGLSIAQIDAFKPQARNGKSKKKR